ncbi:hypothetical protein GJ633_05960 [Halorubrum sp. CBA1125]|uniref:hypothetical protein n=1 Tax=Halorubrum sp. CBA1125 TaxID=2668072 RepID=UPI0012E949F0|nr:hypothetical protein [Halorubrum sp. CBA1125]MUW14253.1 hypothetical protein [Halorubrum sp. CBA1125]
MGSRPQTDDRTRTGAHTDSQRRGRRSRPGRRSGWFGRSALSISGIALLTATKAADALTTGLGLAYVPGVYEANPMVRVVFERMGITEGLVVSSFVIVAGIVLITELASVGVAKRRPDGHFAPLVRLVGYGLPSMVFAAVALRNAGVLVAGIGGLF